MADKVNLTDWDYGGTTILTEGVSGFQLIITKVAELDQPVVDLFRQIVREEVERGFRAASIPLVNLDD